MRFYLLFFLIFLQFFFISCNEENNLNIKNRKKITDENLELKKLPVDTTLIGFIDFNKPIKANWFIQLIKDGAILSDVNIIFDKTTRLLFFFNIDDFLIKKDFRGSVVLKNVSLYLKNIRKKRKYNDAKISVIDEDLAFSVVNNDFLIGTSFEVEKTIDIISGKLRNLASTPRNSKFKNIISKLSEDNFLKIAFIPNNKIQNLLIKISNKRKYISEFLNNLYGMSLGISMDSSTTKITISVVISSNKKGISQIFDIINSFINRTKNNVTNRELVYLSSKTELKKRNNFLYLKTVIPHTKFIEYIVYWYDL